MNVSPRIVGAVWLIGLFYAAGCPVSVVVRVELVCSIVVVWGIGVIVAVFPVFWAVFVPARLPIGVAVGVYLVGPVVVVSTGTWSGCASWGDLPNFYNLGCCFSESRPAMVRGGCKRICGGYWEIASTPCDGIGRLSD